MEREALKLALDVLLEMSPSGSIGSDIWQKQMSAITTIAKALAQPVQEPVGTLNISRYKGHLVNHDFDYFGELPDGTYSVYTTPPAAQPAQEPDALTIAYQSGYYDGKQAALAGREWNFCERCGKRTNDIHTCTPPQGAA